MHQHTKEKCEELYSKKIHGNHLFCEYHIKTSLYQGGVCKYCHPNLTVLGIPQDSVKTLLKKKPEHVFHIYTLRNSNVDYNPIYHTHRSSNPGNFQNSRDNEPQMCSEIPKEIIGRIFLAGLPPPPPPPNQINSPPQQSLPSSSPPPPSDSPPPSPTSNNALREFIQHEVEYSPFLCFKVRDPPVLQHPHLYLYDNINRIIQNINSSQLLRNSHNNSYKAWIWADSHFKRTEYDEAGCPYDARDFMFHNTHAIKLPAYSEEKLSKKNLYSLIKDLCYRFNHVHESLARSGWSHEYTDNIRIVLAHYQGRPLESTGRLKSSKNIESFIAYPKGRRGARYCINFNYTKMLINKKLKNREVCEGDPKFAPCVRFALKAHYINHSTTLPNKNEVMTKLLTIQDAYKYGKNTEQALVEQHVKIPKNLFSKGITLKDFGQLESVNKLPIAVYYLTKCKIDPKGVYINTLRAPKRSKLEKYNTPVCHLLMLSDDHVAYIPNMEEYMQCVFDHRIARGDQPINQRTIRRCPYCFNVLLNKDYLKSHLIKGTCYSDTSQPAAIHLPARGSKIKYENITDAENPELTVILDTESKLVDADKFPTSNSTGDNDIHSSSPEHFESVFMGMQNDQIADHKISKQHIPQSIGMMFIDEKNRDIGYEEFIDDDVQYTFADNLTKHIQKQMDDISSKRCITPYLTKPNIKAFYSATHCGHCKGEFSRMPSKSKHKHHDHTIHPVYDDKGNIIKGNYLDALCSFCNLRVTSKRKHAICLFHNGSSYDVPQLMKGLTSNKENIKNIKILPKGPFSYYNVKFKNASFIDSCSFIQAGLAELVDLKCKNIEPHKLIEEIPITVNRVTKMFSEDLIPYIGNKGVYPYKIAQNVKDLESIKEFPEKIHFYDDLKDEPIADDDYERGKKVWEILELKFGNQMSLKVLHSFYLLTDISLLADVWIFYCNLIKSDFNVHPANSLTGPGLAYKAALRMGKTDLEQLHCHSQFLDFESSLRGGFVSVTKRHVVCNNIELGEKYDRDKKYVFLIFIDWNSLYSQLLSMNLPVGLFTYLEDPKNFDKQEIMKIDTSNDAEVGYFVTASITIPEHLKKLYDDLPLGLVNTDKINPSPHTKSINELGGNHKLVAGHFDLNEYTFDIELLQFYLEMGCELVETHRVISFDQKQIFKPYIDHCVQRRKKEKNKPILNRMYKLLANSLYGRTILNDRKYNTNTRLYHRADLNRPLSDPKFRKLRMVSSDCYSVTKNKSHIMLKSPIYIGAMILQKAKLQNFRFHYKVVKPSAANFPKEHIICDEKDK